MTNLENKNQKTQNLHKYFLSSILSFLCAFIFLSTLVFPGITSAQLRESTSVARTIPVADAEVSFGDVILYDNENNLYRLSFSASDPRFFGIVVENPTLIVETDEDLVPVLQSGIIPVNVTLENGAIEIGDPITTASFAGKGMRALENEKSIFGFAVEALDVENAVQDEDSDTLMGTILVEVGGERVVAHLASLESLSRDQSEESVENKETSEGSTEATIRFGFAALVALGSIFLIYFAFASSIKHGVVSVGRNPRARSSIRSMVILNVILAIVVTAAAIFFAISLLVTGS